MTGRRRVTVLGGTGFPCRRIARHFLDNGFLVRIATRHPERGATIVRLAVMFDPRVRADRIRSGNKIDTAALE
jgi:uncharacterized protein YbjT (DUF2867 family)